jgi:hypothetical protein
VKTLSILATFFLLLAQSSMWAAEDTLSFIEQALQASTSADKAMGLAPLDVTYLLENVQDRAQQKLRFVNQPKDWARIAPLRDGDATERWLIRLVKTADGSRSYNVLRVSLNPSNQFELTNNLLILETSGKQRRITFKTGQWEHELQLMGDFEVSIDVTQEHMTRSFLPNLNLPEAHIDSELKAFQGMVAKTAINPSLIESFKINTSKDQIDFLTSDWGYPSIVSLKKSTGWLPAGATGRYPNIDEKVSLAFGYAPVATGSVPGLLFPSQVSFQRTFQDKPYLTSTYKLLSAAVTSPGLKMDLNDPKIIAHYQVDRRFLSALLAH